jgi:hypothetical protein
LIETAVPRSTSVKRMWSAPVVPPTTRSPPCISTAPIVTVNLAISLRPPSSSVTVTVTV